MSEVGQRVRLVAVVGAGMLLVFGAVSFVHRVGASQPLVGVEWAQASAGPIAVVVEEGGPAWRAGLQDGDRLVAVNGRGVESAIEASELGWFAGSGGPLELRIERAGTERELRFAPDWNPRTEPFTYLSIVGLAFWVSGLFIALRWPEIRGGRIYTVLAMTLFAQLTLSHTGRADALDWSIYWTDLIAGAFAPALMLHLGIALSRRTLKRRRGVVRAAYLIAVGTVLVAIWLSPAALGGAYRFADPVRAVEMRDRLEPLLLATALLLTFLLLVKSHRRSSSALHRSQMRWLLWGLAVGMGPFVTLYAAPWALGAPPLPSWAQLVAVVPLLLVPGAFTAALARYRPYDLDLFLLRGFFEVTAVFCAFAVYAVTVFLLREGLNELIDLSRSATRYIGILVMAVSYPPLRSWVRAGVDRAFYRKRYSYRATLLDWARELNLETDLPSLLGRLRTRVCETLGTPRAEVLVRTGDRRFSAVDGSEPRELELDEPAMEHLERESCLTPGGEPLSALPWAGYLFAMKVKGRLRAVLAIAEREPPEEPLTTEDRALLGTLAAHAATAIEAARLVLEVRQRADEIESLHERQARILQSSAVGLLLLDTQGRIQDWNRALEEIYGLPRNEALGMRLSDVFPIHVARRIERDAAAAAPGAEVRIFRLIMINRLGQRVVVNLAISPVDTVAGGQVITIDDVTEHEALEEQVLRQERLASLGMLAAGVAHEINTPLTGISSYAQMLLEDEKENGTTRSTLEKIEAQTKRAAEITNSLLTLARPEQTALEPLDLNETIGQVLQLFAPQVRGRGIRMRIGLDDDLPRVRGHRGKLQQVLLNLLINARDAVQDGGIVSVSSYLVDRKVAFEVMDDGAGISEEDLPRIFDPFFTTKRRGRGTGLGLSISYGIVQELEGEIRVESQSGQFTRFQVMLPASDSARAMA